MCGQKASVFVDFDSRACVVYPDLIIVVTFLFLVIIVLALVQASLNMSWNSSKHNFVLLQEHWLSKSQFHRIKNIPYDNNVSSLSHDVSGIDNHAFLSGRGYNGCSIL